MMTTDTLQMDSARWAVWTTDPDYDFGRELAQTDRTLLDQLAEAFQRWMASLFNETLSGVGEEAWWAFAVIALIAILLMLAITRPELFGRKNKQLDDVEDDAEDTIYRDHFDRDIRQAAEAKNWRQACRLTYLHALRLLHDSGRIAWLPYKTPTQYTREVTTADFRTLTRHFMRIRYGGFAATEDLFQTMQTLFASVTAAPEGQAEPEGKASSEAGKGGAA